jgi:YidC/Oxa1 family membrane protein insertase
VWTLGQQFYVIRNNPTPGSQAELELKARRAARGLPPVGHKKSEEETAPAVVETKVQRQQPQRKNRKKR